MSFLNEGGNVFKDKMGVPLTRRIKQNEIPSTIDWLESITGLDLHGPKDPRTGYPMMWLGSTGKKPDSGDLDLAVELGVTTKPELKAKLDQYVTSQGMDPRDFVRLTGEAVHFKTPIQGDADNGFVQTDFMFMPNVNWGAFFLSGGVDSQYKGMFRNVLMSSIAKAQGLKASAKGVTSRTTDQVITMDPDQAAEILLGPGNTRDNLKNVESIYAALARDPDREAKIKDFREYLAREGMKEPETNMQESDVSFIARLRDRIVNQGMQPLVEHEAPVPLTEAKDPRIPHLEDLIFKSGSRGIDQALQIAKHSADNTKEHVTIKWDGKPAVFFGRKPTGEFVLTDKSGLTAVGYDGMATSPEMIADIMARRDAAAKAKGKPADRSQLAKTYADIWPYFEAATPENFRGYIKGDLLYYPQQMYVEEAGNFVFQPNEVLYRIPIASELGQLIQGTQVGIAIHTEIEDVNAPEQPIDPKRELLPVPGLMMSKPTVENLQSLQLNSELVKKIKGIKAKYGSAIDTLFNPADLRAMEITDLPALMEKFINSLVGTDFSDATPNAFLAWLQDPKNKVSPRKFNNIYAYISSPRSNIDGMAAAFTVWNLLHKLKTDLLQQLDLQHPGQEGWVFATPAGRAKAVNRMAGGFTAANRARNNPPAA